jgi:C4-dicarboxylate-specific signal transduction histidine kinase
MHQGRPARSGKAAAGRREVTVLTDRTSGIRASVEDVQFELVLAVVLVVLVIFMFLARRATLIAGFRCRSRWSAPLRRCGRWVFDQQPDADGADHRLGLRGR